MKTLKQLADWLRIEWAGPDRKLGDLHLDSRKIRQGDVFVALAGSRTHGLSFAPQAAARGAALILTDRPDARVQGIPCLSVAGLGDRLGALARWFYDAPDERLAVIGVTGTNGKSSTCWFVAQLLEGLDVPAALIGTLGWGRPGQLQPLANTTPDAPTLYRLLHGLATSGIEAVAMEVSSHAIELGRIDGLRFDTVALTQVRRDHLDFHGSEEAYRAAKARLFTDWPSRRQVLNLDDALGRELATRCPNPVTYGTGPGAQVCCRQLTATESGLTGIIGFQHEEKPCRTPILGLFNGENLAAALAIVEKWGRPHHERLIEGLAALRPLEGRMEKVRDNPTVIIDYAHTPDGLEALLESVRAHWPDRTLWLVFGAGGERDRGKRRLMGEVADRLADRIILTSDNPRCEDPHAIMAQVAEGISRPHKQVPDRARAIQIAMQCAADDDVVVIAGKGHERTQQFCGETRPFSDRDEALKWRR
ncbi:UDP-N-acetylmuramoyl-L-alanyl-D-glutamate--2,6-diaminopimelate ligase [Sulfurivirga sp.]|uniref:UDP-N-acetylmuramoyl-L-alanyl-D-glutamate--2, 6-diaminopimelate ligase n=1 Tax=Sulfurivirga sp. TaxID=2614236 RepID=UPI0025DC2C59|nr:UDP-N-acetylmuramoyl-L-alanyl-D-glutamate--2,6-diaminopimelate ligase [Sulfurivirga sp.]